MSARNFADAEQLATDAIRELTGYGRVKIYKFLPDASGEVSAESRDEALPSYRGLHFPATDIPKQARHLYSILPFRPSLSVDDDISPIVTNLGKSRRLARHDVVSDAVGVDYAHCLSSQHGCWISL